MKAESNVKPSPLEIIPLNDDEVEVLFYDNIETLQPTDEEDTAKYSYDYYRLIIRNRENLQATIEANFDAWISLAKEKEVRKTIHIPTAEDRLAILEDAINFVLGL